MCKEDNGCKDCFESQRELNQALINTVTDAQKEANKTGKRVAIIQEGRNYRYELYTGQPKAISIIKPL